MTSLTGVVSGSVTSTTCERVGSRSSSRTSSPGPAPVRRAPRRAGPAADVRNVTAWPAAGPSTTMTSHSPLRSSCLILPSTTMSSMPGAAVATTSITPEVDSRLATRRTRDRSRYSARAVDAEISWHGRLAEPVPQHRLAVELDGEHALTGIRGRPCQDRRYRGLADPSLPRHDRHPGGGQQRYWIDGLRRHLCAD